MYEYENIYNGARISVSSQIVSKAWREIKASEKPKEAPTKKPRKNAKKEG